MASIQSNSELLAIDGVRATSTLRPSSAEEVADALGTADRDGHAIAPVGGGTKLALGNTPTKLDYLLSTAALDKVLHYEPTDLTLSVQAGMRFADVQALLREHGQTLPVETPEPERATIGGMIATALAGPRRYGSGTLRDLLIGISVAYPSGIVGKAGGLVVKNVTGFDLMRLHLGALGTLGVIVSANFKVLPAARHESTLITAPQGISDAFASAGAAARGRLRPISIEIFKAGDGWIMAARLEGRPSTVELGIAELRGAVAADRVVQADESRAWWREYLHGQRLTETGDGVVLRCGFPPKTSETAVSRIQTALVSHDISPEIWTVSPGLGAVVVGFNRPAGGSLKPVQDALLVHAENVSVLAAPADLKSDIDVWGRRPETVHVMQALKAEFDPNNVLNPGRFVDRI